MSSLTTFLEISIQFCQFTPDLLQDVLRFFGIHFAQRMPLY